MARQIMDLLEEINHAGTTIIMVTHSPELAQRAHRTVHIVDGQLTELQPYEPHPAATLKVAGMLQEGPAS
jgi:putative ABC transport system ATP-binding protein